MLFLRSLCDSSRKCCIIIESEAKISIWSFLEEGKGIVCEHANGMIDMHDEKEERETKSCLSFSFYPHEFFPAQCIISFF